MSIVLDILLLLTTIIYSYLESLVKVFIPQRRKSVAGEIVLITGAGHGIGRMTAYEFAKRKSRLVLWDVNKHGVEETAAECRNLGATVHVFVVDCSNREMIYNSVNQVKKEVGDVTIIVNNAGTVYPADLLSTKDEEITKTFEVNTLGHFWITKALLPSMMKRNHGHIVTVASVCGHGVIPYLIPYWLWPILETEEVARSLIDGILTNKKMIFVPSYINIYLTLMGFLPERAIAAINHLQNIQFEAVVGHKTKMK
ncbi:17-beta-hydroxysteroid dehydrogenase 13 isoform X2 [Manis javanica]|uniref:17-beta-hydroxysteroid dehydrogenase 13 isoform X2 n=1 Tax=Manis javanica TaxID=9974 RepID=UPI000812EE4B|nr:17-beta-hydroxysteroid dehydrogenase 13 isoform X2 [Manis javanica]